MNLKIGTKIQYTCALGTCNATIVNIDIAPTAREGFLNTWLTLAVAVQEGVTFPHTTRIPADNGSLKMFNVTIVD